VAMHSVRVFRALALDDGDDVEVLVAVSNLKPSFPTAWPCLPSNPLQALRSLRRHRIQTIHPLLLNLETVF